MVIYKQLRNNLKQAGWECLNQQLKNIGYVYRRIVTTMPDIGWVLGKMWLVELMLKKLQIGLIMFDVR